MKNISKNRVATNAKRQEAQKGKTMKVLFERGVIEMTQAEMKAAEVYGSEMYKNLMNARHDNPGFKVVVAEAKPKKGKTPLDKLSLKTIKDYVKANGTPEQKQTFLDMSVAHYTDEGIYIEAQSFFEIKQWFFAEFPKYKEALDNHEAKMKKIFKNVDKKIAEAKAKAVEEARAKAKKEAADFLAAS